MRCLPYPGSKSDVLDGGVVWKLWGRIKHRSRRCFPRETFFPQPLPIFMKCLLSAFMLRDRFFSPRVLFFRRGFLEFFPHRSGEAGSGSFPPPPLFPSPFSFPPPPALN